MPKYSDRLMTFQFYLIVVYHIAGNIDGLYDRNDIAMYDQLPCLVYTKLVMYIAIEFIINVKTYKHIAVDVMFSCPVSPDIK